MFPIRPDSTDPAYLDAFLQGARFALFAVEGRLKGTKSELPADIEAAIDEFHDLFKATRDGIEGHEPPIELVQRYVGKN